MSRNKLMGMLAHPDAPPTRNGLRSITSHVTWELRFQLGLAIAPCSAQGSRCFCNNQRHAPCMACPLLSSSCHMRHGYFKPQDDCVSNPSAQQSLVQRCSMCRVAVAVDPSLRAMQMQPGA